jgi:hypothetical protein
MRCTHRRSNLLVAGFGLFLGACADPTEPSRSLSPEPTLAKVAATAGPTVTSTLPSEAEQGTTLDVEINGSGFDQGSLAHFERNGAADSRVRVNSTRFVKSAQLVANLTIALDAEVSPYDVVVITAAGKKGIGTEQFTVRVGMAVGAWTLDPAQSINFAADGRGEYVNGQCGITGAIFYGNYDPSTGMGGDGILDKISAGSAGCLPREIRVTLNGVSRRVSLVPVRQIVGLRIGESRTQNLFLQLDAADPNCTHLAWWVVAEGGAGGQITVSRTASDRWLATTNGNARCFYLRGMKRVYTTIFKELTDVQASFVIKQQP